MRMAPSLQAEVLTEQNGDVLSIVLLSPCYLTVGIMRAATSPLLQPPPPWWTTPQLCGANKLTLELALLGVPSQ